MSNTYDSIPLTQLQSSAAAQFTAIGDKYSGVIVNIDSRSQTDPVTGKVKTFNDGTPMPQWVITIEADNGNTVALWAKGGNFTAAEGTGKSMTSAIADAVKAAGESSLKVGGMLAVAYTGEGVAKAGLNAPKLYTAQYRPPAPQAVSVDVADLFNT